MEKEVQEFIGKEILRHSEVKGFAFLLDQEELLEKAMDKFSLNRSEALWQMTQFIQDNAGPEGDLVIIERDGKRLFQWRFVEWPSWLPSWVKKPKWHREPHREGMSALDY
jgi:hypothetical protein